MLKTGCTNQLNHTLFFFNRKIILLVQIIDKRMNVHVNNIINQLKTYIFDNLVYIFDITIVIKIFIIQILQYIDDH